MKENYSMKDAFKELNILTESEAFRINDEKQRKALDDFIKGDDYDDFEMIIDLEAEDEEDLKDSYIDNVIIECPTCRNKFYKNQEELIPDEEQPEYVNVDEECAICNSVGGFKIIGKVAPYSENTEEETDEESNTEDIEAALDTDTEEGDSSDIEAALDSTEDTQTVDTDTENNDESEAVEINVNVNKDKNESLNRSYRQALKESDENTENEEQENTEQASDDENKENTQDTDNSNQENVDTDFNALLNRLQKIKDYSQFVKALKELNPAQKKLFMKKFGEVDIVRPKISQKPVATIKLIPTQSEIDWVKSLTPNLKQDCSFFFKSPVTIWGTPVLTFKEKYIIDGHHRWSQAFIFNPRATLSCIDFSYNESNPQDVLKDFQGAILAQTGQVPVGKAGTNIWDVTQEELLKFITENIQDVCWKSLVTCKVATDKQSAIKYILKNAMILKEKVKPIANAAAREDMPQTSEETIARATKISSMSESKLKEYYEPLNSFKSFKYLDKTNQGYEIVKIYHDLDDDRLHVIAYRPKSGDYAVGLGYTPDGGHWNQGWYDFNSFETAEKALKAVYKVEEYIHEPKVQEAVEDKKELKGKALAQAFIDLYKEAGENKTGGFGEKELEVGFENEVIFESQMGEEIVYFNEDGSIKFVVDSNLDDWAMTKRDIKAIFGPTVKFNGNHFKASLLFANFNDFISYVKEEGFTNFLHIDFTSLNESLLGAAAIGTGSASGKSINNSLIESTSDTDIFKDKEVVDAIDSYTDSLVADYAQRFSDVPDDIDYMLSDFEENMSLDYFISEIILVMINNNFPEIIIGEIVDLNPKVKDRIRNYNISQIIKVMYEYFEDRYQDIFLDVQGYLEDAEYDDDFDEKLSKKVKKPIRESTSDTDIFKDKEVVDAIDFYTHGLVEDYARRFSDVPDDIDYMLSDFEENMSLDYFISEIILESIGRNFPEIIIGEIVDLNPKVKDRIRNYHISQIIKVMYDYFEDRYRDILENVQDYLEDDDDDFDEKLSKKVKKSNSINRKPSKKLKEFYAPLSSFKTFGSFTETIAGSKILKFYRDLDDGRLHIIVKSEFRGHYDVCLDYRPNKGIWDHGWYDFETFEDAEKALKARCNVEEYNVEEYIHNHKPKVEVEKAKAKAMGDFNKEDFMENGKELNNDLSYDGEYDLSFEEYCDHFEKEDVENHLDLIEELYEDYLNLVEDMRDDYDEFDEQLFEQLVKKHINETYDNVSNFKTTEVSLNKNKNKLVVEGILSLKNGKKGKSKFVFESIEKSNKKISMIGYNETFSKTKKAFKLVCGLKEHKLSPKVLNYNYSAKSLNESKRVSGRVILK